MKRLSLISILALMPLTMFAYYGDYDSSPSVFVSFLMFVLLVWGILEVILFFKVWKMTNDVNKIKNDLTFTNVQERIRKYRLLGQNDKVSEILIQDFLDDMEKRLRPFPDVYDPALNIEKKVADLEFQLMQIGENLPEEFRRLKVLRDYNKLGYIEKNSDNESITMSSEDSKTVIKE